MLWLNLVVEEAEKIFESGKKKELNNLCVSLSLENKLLSGYWDPEDGAMRILKNNKEGLK